VKQFLKNSEISRLLPDFGEEGGLTKETHLVKKGNEKYVLRICRDMETANLYEALSKKFEKYGFLPKLLKRQGKKLLYEYIPGRDLRKSDALKLAYQVGKIAGRISETPFSGQEKIDFDERFYKELDYLIRKSIIDKQKAVHIKEKYKELRETINPKNCLEIVDPCPDNFRLSKGKVYLVDIHAIKIDMKGRSFAKTFMKWFKTKTQRKRFEEGYNSVSSMKFLTKNYLELVYLYHLVKNIAMKARDKRDYKTQLNKLNKILKGDLK